MVTSRGQETKGILLSAVGITRIDWCPVEAQHRSSATSLTPGPVSRSTPISGGTLTITINQLNSLKFVQHFTFCKSTFDKLFLF